MAWEARANEPILPLRLFRNPIFTVASAITFLVGLALFGAVVYLPEYLQVVQGASAISSGLQLIPLTLGIVIASAGCGQLVSRFGRYKVFPIIGATLLTAGFWLLTHIQVTTSTAVLSWWMLVVGLGIGCIMQIAVLAVQNPVAYQDLGIATSATVFFRLLGGSLGTAMFGAVLLNRLQHTWPCCCPRGPVDARRSTSAPCRARPSSCGPCPARSCTPCWRRSPAPTRPSTAGRSHARSPRCCYERRHYAPPPTPAATRSQRLTR